MADDDPWSAEKGYCQCIGKPIAMDDGRTHLACGWCSQWRPPRDCSANQASYFRGTRGRCADGIQARKMRWGAMFCHNCDTWDLIDPPVPPPLAPPPQPGQPPMPPRKRGYMRFSRGAIMRSKGAGRLQSRSCSLFAACGPPPPARWYILRGEDAMPCSGSGKPWYVSHRSATAFGGVDGLCPRAKMVLHWATNVRSCWDHIPRGAVALAVSQEPHQDFRLIVLKSLFYRAPKPFDGSALIPWIGPRAK